MPDSVALRMLPCYHTELHSGIVLLYKQVLIPYTPLTHRSGQGSIMKQIKQVLATISVIAACNGAFIQVAQAEVVSIKMTGTISRGYDGLGIFGTPGADLTGQNFAQFISTNLADGYERNFRPDAATLGYIKQTGATLNGSAQVGTHRFQWTVTDARGIFDMYNTLSSRHYFVDYLNIQGDGANAITADGYKLSAGMFVQSTSQPFLNSLDTSQSVTFNPQGLSTRSLFILQRDGNTTYFESTPLASSIALNPVPEPETWAMLVAGIGMLGFAARRKSRAREQRVA